MRALSYCSITITRVQQYKLTAVAEMGDRGHNRHMGRKEGAVVPFSQGAAASPSKQCGLGRGLLPYQVATSSIQPFGHNRHGLKLGAGCSFFSRVGAGSPSNTKLPETRPTFIPIGQPAVWQQQTLAENWGRDCAPLGEGSWVSI